MNQSTRSLTESDLQPGDVLLSLGKGDLSDAIRGLDGGSYSHAAIWSGTDVIEATLPAVHAIPLSESRGKARYIDVYRHKEGAARSAQVVASAQEYLGRAYAESDLLLATAILSISSWMPGEWGELNLLFGAGKLRGMLDALLRLHHERPSERVTCVGLAARAHLSAQLPIEVRLQSGRRFELGGMVRALKKLRSLRPPPPARDDLEALTPDGELTEAISDLESALERRAALESASSEGNDFEAMSPATDDASARREREYWENALASAGLIPADDGLEMAVGELRERRMIAGGDWSASLLTPRQLQESESLVLIGRIWTA